MVELLYRKRRRFSQNGDDQLRHGASFIELADAIPDMSVMLLYYMLKKH